MRGLTAPEHVTETPHQHNARRLGGRCRIPAPPTNATSGSVGQPTDVTVSEYVLTLRQRRQVDVPCRVTRSCQGGWRHPVLVVILRAANRTDWGRGYTYPSGVHLKVVPSAAIAGTSWNTSRAGVARSVGTRCPNAPSRRRSIKRILSSLTRPAQPGVAVPHPLAGSAPRRQGRPAWVALSRTARRRPRHGSSACLRGGTG